MKKLEELLDACEAAALVAASARGVTSQAVDGGTLQVDDDPKYALEPDEGFDNYCQWGDDGGNNLVY